MKAIKAFFALCLGLSMLCGCAAPSPPGETKLTLEALVKLSEKGEDLTMADLRAYEGEDPLSGLYGWSIALEDGYSLMASSGSMDSLIAAVLHKDGTGEGIDIRYYDVAAYVETGERKLVRPLPTDPPPTGSTSTNP